MIRFSLIKFAFFIFLLLYSKNLASEESIIPKPQPKNVEIQKNTIILPKTRPENIVVTEERKLIPKKKPITESSVKVQSKIKKHLLPKKKPIDPISTKIEIQVSEEKSIEKKEIVKIDDSGIIYPKKKPITYHKQKDKVAAKSKFFSKSDFRLAKKIFSEIEKKRWINAQKLSKKAKDKSIHKLVKWLYLLERNNKANFYDYINFINLNPNFPRLNRLKYLAEHKINTQTVTEKRIIKLFDGTEPLSGYGKLMFNKSFLSSLGS